MSKKIKSHSKTFQYWILKFRGYQHVVQKVCKIWANFGNFWKRQNCAQNILPIEKSLHHTSKKGEQVNSWSWTRNSYLKNWDNGKGKGRKQNILFILLSKSFSDSTLA